MVTKLWKDKLVSKCNRLKNNASKLLTIRLNHIALMYTYLHTYTERERKKHTLLPLDAEGIDDCKDHSKLS